MGIATSEIRESAKPHLLICLVSSFADVLLSQFFADRCAMTLGQYGVVAFMLSADGSAQTSAATSEWRREALQPASFCQ